LLGDRQLASDLANTSSLKARREVYKKYEIADEDIVLANYSAAAWIVRCLTVAWHLEAFEKDMPEKRSGPLSQS